MDAQPGRISWIGLRPERNAEMQIVSQADLSEAGLVGDHGRAGKRAITLFQAEHLPAVSAFLGGVRVLPEQLRRNIHISGLNLSALRGVPLSIGTAKIEITTICAPCSRMHSAFGHGGYNALRGHGGWCAQVLRPGAIQLGDQIIRA